jgi:hypothetical protein
MQNSSTQNKCKTAIEKLRMEQAALEQQTEPL